jgi:hypothetical protein
MVPVVVVSRARLLRPRPRACLPKTKRRHDQAHIRPKMRPRKRPARRIEARLEVGHRESPGSERVSTSVVEFGRVQDQGVWSNVIARQSRRVVRFDVFQANRGIHRLHRAGLMRLSTYCRRYEREAGEARDFGAWSIPVSARHFASRAASFRFRFF